MSTVDARLAALEGLVDSLNRSLIEKSTLISEQKFASDTGWTVLCGTLIILMQVGFAMLESGSVREPNVITTYAKNVIDLLVGTAIAALWGYSLSWGLTANPLEEDWLDPISGAARAEDWVSYNGHVTGGFFFHCAYQATSATIVSGAMAERTGLRAYIAICILISGLIYPLAVRFAWSEEGFLHKLDPPFHDFAGSGAVHTVGGFTALTAIVVLGPRIHRVSTVGSEPSGIRNQWVRTQVGSDPK